MTESCEQGPSIISSELVGVKPERDSINILAESKMAKLAVGSNVEISIDKTPTAPESSVEIDDRIAELSAKLGLEYTSQRADIQRAIAMLPETGIRLKKRLDPESGKEIVSDDQKITPDNMVFIRATDNPPIEIDGKRTVQTAFEATRTSSNPIFRLTTHWTANNIVQDHYGGQFEGRKSIIIAPGKDMIDGNGTPEAMLPVDTYWNRSVTLPENSIIVTYDRNELGKDIIGLEEDDDIESIVTLAVSAMGYSTVKNYASYTETAFDIGVNDIARDMGIMDNSLHANMLRMENAIEDFLLEPTSRQGPALSDLDGLVEGYWNQLPIEVKKATIDSLKWWASDDKKDESYYVYNEEQGVQDDLSKLLYTPDYEDTDGNIKNFISSIPTEVFDHFKKNELSHGLE